MENMAASDGTSEEDEEEAMFIGNEPRQFGPVILSPEDSRRLWERVKSREPVVLSTHTLKAIANYKRIMAETVNKPVLPAEDEL